MARPRNHQQHLHTAVEDLLRSITGLLTAVGGAVAGSGDPWGGDNAPLC